MAEERTTYEAVLTQARAAVDTNRCIDCGSLFECPHSFATDLPLWAAAAAAILMALPDPLKESMAEVAAGVMVEPE